MAVKNTILLLPLTQVADPNGIFEIATPGGSGDLTLDGALVIGGEAVFAEPRRIEAIFVADESAKTVIFTGENRFNRVISETVTGAEINATTYITKLDFKKITAVNVSAAFTGNLTIGTGGRAASKWIGLDAGKNPFNVGILNSLVGTSTYFIDVSSDENAALEEDSTVRFITHDDFAAAKAVSFLSQQTQPVRFIRSRRETLVAITDTLTSDINQAGS